jgi:protoheme IX farnesyltransferase
MFNVWFPAAKGDGWSAPGKSRNVDKFAHALSKRRTLGYHKKKLKEKGIGIVVETGQYSRRTSVIRDYVQLIKPGILRSNVLAAFAGFWLASRWQIDWLLMAVTLAGTTLVMASSCVINNLLDRDLDARMARTKKRALPSGRIPVRHAAIYAAVLGLAGTLLLLSVNVQAAALGLFGMFVYIVIYTYWLKRRSPLSTFVGAFSGAVPPAIGYVAAKGTLDAGGWLLALILFLWQPPHFWALGIMRRDDYREAGFKILPVVRGIRRTQWQMVPYVLLLLPAGALLSHYGYTGRLFMAVSLAAGAVWLAVCIGGLAGRDAHRWAKRAFIMSIYYLIIIPIAIVIDTARI